MHPIPTPIAVGEVTDCPFDALFIEDAPTAAIGLLVGVKLGCILGCKLGAMLGDALGAIIGASVG